MANYSVHLICHFNILTTLPDLHRPMKNSDINLMDDNQNEWDDEDPDCRRLRVRKTYRLSFFYKTIPRSFVIVMLEGLLCPAA